MVSPTTMLCSQDKSWWNSIIKECLSHTEEWSWICRKNCHPLTGQPSDSTFPITPSACEFWLSWLQSSQKCSTNYKVFLWMPILSLAEWLRQESLIPSVFLIKTKKLSYHRSLLISIHASLNRKTTSEYLHEYFYSELSLISSGRNRLPLMTAKCFHKKNTANGLKWCTSQIRSSKLPRWFFVNYHVKHQDTLLGALSVPNATITHNI